MGLNHQETGTWPQKTLHAVSAPPAPLPMEAIEKMAALCMKDTDEEGDDEEELEDEDDLMVRRG